MCVYVCVCVSKDNDCRLLRYWNCRNISVKGSVGCKEGLVYREVLHHRSPFTDQNKQPARSLSHLELHQA
jgi:hypothetical protein